MKNTNLEKMKKQKKLIVILSCCALIILAGAIILIPKLSQNNKSANIPNPTKQVLTLNEANALTGFTAKKPGVLPFEVKRLIFYVVGNKTTQVTYESIDGNVLVYRMSSLKEDISGDYNKYAITETITIDNVKVKLKGDAKDQYLLATWNDGTFSYSVFSTLAISLDDFSSLFKSIH